MLGKWIIYIACAGQKEAAPLGYSPLPPNLVKADFEAVRRIPGAPKPPPLTPQGCPNPTITGAGYGGQPQSGSGGTQGGTSTQRPPPTTTAPTTTTHHKKHHKKTATKAPTTPTTTPSDPTVDRRRRDTAFGQRAQGRVRRGGQGDGRCDPGLDVPAVVFAAGRLSRFWSRPLIGLHR